MSVPAGSRPPEAPGARTDPAARRGDVPGPLDARWVPALLACLTLGIVADGWEAATRTTVALACLGAAAAAVLLAARAPTPDWIRGAGTAVALIGGDVLLVEALRLAMTCTPDPGRAAPVAAVVLDAATASAAGELEDVLLGLARHTGEEPEPERILAMQRLKTAHYTVSAPLRAGALLAGADPDVAAGLGEAGADLGVAYQVVDDVLGVFGAPEQTGKSADGDLREGKATVLTAHGRRDPAVRALLDAGPATPEELEAARRA
ncbi:polyprenyl synthetase family protein, partial [Micrococcus sp. HG099]|uniref:polyprenyl synthetase family protein n=1 Tax=Micrococcus sp. HG099 TaxID=2969755 RepID=UPI00215A7EE1